MTERLMAHALVQLHQEANHVFSRWKKASIKQRQSICQSQL